MERNTYSFASWCIDHNKKWLLEYWDSETNKCSPYDVPYRSNQKYSFWCGNDQHPRITKYLYNITNSTNMASRESFCVGCHSIGKYISDEFGDEYLYELWSKDNSMSPYEVSIGSAKKIFLTCRSNNKHPDYCLSAYNIKNSFACPYCSGKQVCHDNSFGNKYPESIELWSDLNDDTPYDYTPMSNQAVYMKCPIGKHKDFKRKICAHVEYGFRCPECSKENVIHLRGNDSPNWNPDLSEDRHFRFSNEYDKWRTAVFERDGYICQCCLNKKHNRLNAHHILSFANHKDLRLDINNGLTMCVECHSSLYEGSLHNIYGTRDISPEILQSYINDKRKALGINVEFYLPNGFLNLLAS